MNSSAFSLYLHSNILIMYWMTQKKVKKKKRRRLKPAVFYTLVILLIFLVIYIGFKVMFPDLISIMMKGDEEAIEAYLESQGMWKGMIAIYIICLLQVVSIVIPGMPIQIAAGVIYGWWDAFLICYFGFVSAQTLVFFAVRTLRRKVGGFIDSMQGVKRLKDRINASDPMFAAGLACMIPGVPNGIIPYAFSTLRISLFRFALAIACTSWVQILCNCVIGHLLIRGKFIYIVLSFILQWGLIFLVIRYKYYIKRLIRRR